MVSVSIILPTFNRASFLEDAFESISSQTFSDFEVIVVDDGSTDNTVEIISKLQSNSQYPIKLITQINMGPAIARNTGIKVAKGKFIAFFDSDDTWEDDHLNLAISAFKKDSSLDWLYFSCRRIEYSTRNVVLDSTFYTEGKKNQLFSCITKTCGALNYLDVEKATLCQLRTGLDSGLQNSVFKACIFKQVLIPDFKVGEDRLFILMLLKKRYKCAFIDKVTVNYFIHGNNTSDTNISEKNIQKRILALKSLIKSYESTFELVNLSLTERKELRKRLSEDYIWKLGYSLQRENGLHKDAVCSIVKGICYWPYRLKYWKTLIVSSFKLLKI